MNSNLPIGHNISNFRTKQGYSQEELAQYLGVTREFVSMVETGKRELSVTNLNKLADLFGIDMETLLEENADVNKVHLAFAFRSNHTSNDLESIAAFKRVVLEYLKMNQIRHGS